MKFSERMRLAPSREIQLNDIDEALRNRIINKIAVLLDDEQAEYILDRLGRRTVPQEEVITEALFNKKANAQELLKQMKAIPWYNLYDIIEFGLDSLQNKKNKRERSKKIKDYTESLNEILEQEKSGYRIVAGIVAPIIDVPEMKCLEHACDSPFCSAREHIKKALCLYSNRQAPDYENSIKDSINAVESACCEIIGTSSASYTLGQALDKFEERGVIIHKALKCAFKKLYGYTSDAGGIRHGSISFVHAPAEDAQYMLVTCSAFVNYLAEKDRKIKSRDGA